MNQEKGVPAANFSSTTNLLCDLEPVPFPLWASFAPLDTGRRVSILGCCDRWAAGWPEVLLIPNRWAVRGQVTDTGLDLPAGRVLVHCAMGVSRSATIVLAFLMIYENMTLVEAIQKVQTHRDICPNSGFLRQLQVLDNRLGRETGRL